MHKLTAFVNGLIQQGAAGQIFNPQTQSPFPPCRPHQRSTVLSVCTVHAPCPREAPTMYTWVHPITELKQTIIQMDKVYFLDRGGHTEKVWRHCYKNSFKSVPDSCAKRLMCVNSDPPHSQAPIQCQCLPLIFYKDGIWEIWTLLKKSEWWSAGLYWILYLSNQKVWFSLRLRFMKITALYSSCANVFQQFSLFAHIGRCFLISMSVILVQCDFRPI